jgi:hypothetical protein
MYLLPVYDTRVINLPFTKAHIGNPFLAYYEILGDLATIHTNGLGIA